MRSKGHPGIQSWGANWDSMKFYTKSRVEVNIFCFSLRRMSHFLFQWSFFFSLCLLLSSNFDSTNSLELSTDVCFPWKGDESFSGSCPIFWTTYRVILQGAKGHQRRCLRGSLAVSPFTFDPPSRWDWLN